MDKTVKVVAGKFKGKEVILHGEYKKLLGHSPFADAREPMLIEYFKRLALEPVSTHSKTYLATLDGENVILNNYELTGKE